MDTDARGEPTYWLERTDSETRRLIRQASYYNPLTRRMLAEAGIAAGMRVLDIGSGAGDVSLIAAELVGPTGGGVGVDVNASGLDVARERADAAGFANVAFVAGDARAVALDGEFDAVVGRLVLMYQRDPAQALCAFIRHLKPGGVVAFQEFSIRLTWLPEMALWRRLVDWVQAVGQRAGVELAMGHKLRGAFLAVGLPEPRLRLEARIGGGAEFTGYDEAASVLRSLLPLVLKFGIASAEEVEIETLEERLRAETVATGGVVKLPDAVSAWARLP
jgi:SAM-dependent methyltransferase